MERTILVWLNFDDRCCRMLVATDTYELAALPVSGEQRV